MGRYVDKRDDLSLPSRVGRTLSGTRAIEELRDGDEEEGRRAERSCSVLLIDGDAFVATALRDAMGGGEVRAVASIGEALSCIGPAYWSARPADLVVVEVDLRDGDGRTLLEHLARLSPRPAICVVGNRLGTDDFVRRGVFAHPKPVADWRMLVDSLHERHAYGVAVTVAEFAHIHGLSNRERMLLELVADGVPAKEVSSHLKVKPSTIATMWQRIFRRTGMRSQSEVLAAVLQLGARG